MYRTLNIKKSIKVALRFSGIGPLALYKNVLSTKTQARISKVNLYDQLSGNIGFGFSLGSSLFTNGCCIYYIQSQSKQITELIKKNNSLVDSIDKLNSDLLKIEDKTILMNSKFLLIVIKISENGFLMDLLVVFGFLTVSLEIGYFLSTADFIEINLKFEVQSDSAWVIFQISLFIGLLEALFELRNENVNNYVQKLRKYVRYHTQKVTQTMLKIKFDKTW